MAATLAVLGQYVQVCSYYFTASYWLFLAICCHETGKDVVWLTQLMSIGTKHVVRDEVTR